MSNDLITLDGEKAIELVSLSNAVQVLTEGVLAFVEFAMKEKFPGGITEENKYDYFEMMAYCFSLSIKNNVEAMETEIEKILQVEVGQELLSCKYEITHYPTVRIEETETQKG